MKKKEFEKLEYGLLPHLPDFSVKGSLMILPPVKELLRGFCFETSGYTRTAFYVNAFMMPLCVPTDHISLGFGDRLRQRNRRGWDTNHPQLMEELIHSTTLWAANCLRPVKSLHDFVNIAKLFSLGNPHTRQAISYSLIRAGDFEQGRPVLQELLKQLDLSSAWQKEMAERGTMLLRTLDADPFEAQRQLEAWELHTLKNLKLDQ